MSVVLTHEPWERLFAGPTISWASHISSSSHEYHRTRYLVTGWPFCMTDCRAIVLIGIFPSYHEMLTRSAKLLRIDRDALTWTPNSPSAREDPWKRYKTSDESCEVYDNLSESEAMKSRSSLVSEGTVEDFSEGTEQVSVPSDSQFKRTFSGLVMMADKTGILKGLAAMSMLKRWLDLMDLCKLLFSPESGSNLYETVLDHSDVRLRSPTRSNSEYTLTVNTYFTILTILTILTITPIVQKQTNKMMQWNDRGHEKKFQKRHAQLSRSVMLSWAKTFGVSPWLIQSHSHETESVVLQSRRQLFLLVLGFLLFSDHISWKSVLEGFELSVTTV